jgi:glycerol-3-phosphate dehydrogenase
VRLTKGVHLVIDRTRLPVREALVLGDGTGRIVFVIPHGEAILVGTTDTDFDGDRDRVEAAPEDIAYLLQVLADNLAGKQLSAADVQASFAGLRALAANDAVGARAPSSLSREEVVIESPGGLISIAGGKLTTHREIAERLVDRVEKSLGRPARRSPTRDTPLPGARAFAFDDAGGGAQALAALPEDLRAAITARYGTRALIPASIAAERPQLARPLAPGCPVAAAEVVYAIGYEMATSVADFIERRVALSWRHPRCVDAAAMAAARLMAAELGWDAARERAELEACRPAGIVDAAAAEAAASSPIDSK